MTGGSSLCIEGRILPLNEAHVSHEQFNFRCPLPHVVGSPDLKVLSGSLTSVRPSDLPCCLQLVRPYKPGLSLTDLPCSRAFPWLHAGDTNPGSSTECLPWRILSFCLSPSGTGSATSITIDFGAILSFTDVPAYNLPIYASQWPLPDTTQDLVRGCELGFTAAPISGDWITRASKAQPRTDPYVRVYAYGSYEG
jgi:hypothetical protein